MRITYLHQDFNTREISSGARLCEMARRICGVLRVFV